MEPVGTQVMTVFPECAVSMVCHEWQPKPPDDKTTDADDGAASAGEGKAN